MKTNTMTSESAAQHTPGPWRINGSLITAQGDMRTTVASLPSMEDRIVRFQDAAAKTFAQRDANARLIAAAPQLLEALESTLEIMERAKKLLRVAGLDMQGGTISNPYNDAMAQARAAIAAATQP